MNSNYLATLVSQNPSASASDILALARSDTRMVNTISAEDLNPWLGNNGLAPQLQRTADYIKNMDAATAKTVLQLDPSTPDNVAIVTAVKTSDQIIAFITYASSGFPFAVDTADVSLKAVKLMALCVGLNEVNPLLGITQDLANSLVALGGGYQVFDVTLDQINTEIAKQARDKAFFDFNVLIDAPYFTANTVRNTRVSKLDTIKRNGGSCPADLAALDAMGVG